MFIVFVIVVLALSAFAAIEWRFRRRQAREAYIRNFHFPKGIYAKVIKLHPQLSLRDMELVGAGLRQFFLAYAKSGERYVSMPSQVADDLWHEFILYTKNYQDFNRQAFGRFLHHTPAAAVSGNAQSDAGLHRCWQVLCKEENINPLKASRMPLLFALDTKFNIVGGFHYVPDCSGIKREGNNDKVHCGVELGVAALASTDDGHSSWSDSRSDGNSSSKDGGDGDSSSGCGGGGCGGGD